MLANYTPKLGTMLGTPPPRKESLSFMSSPCYEPSSYLDDLVSFPALTRERSEGHSADSTAETLKGYAYHKRQRNSQWSVPLPAVIVSFCCSQEPWIGVLPSCFTRASFSHSGFHLNITTPAQFGVPPEHYHPCKTSSNISASNKHHQLSPKTSSCFVPSQ